MSDFSRMPTAVRTQALTLLNKVTCPHCWHAYAPEESLWIAEHPDLLGDAKLGFQHAKRFLPSRFSPQGGCDR